MQPKLWPCVVGLAASLHAGSVEAEPGSVRHGREITRDLVGPTAAGITPQRTTGMTVLAEGKRAPVGIVIADSTRYAGFVVEGPHLLIEGVIFTGRLDIQTSQPVVVRGCTFRFADWFGIIGRSTSRGVVLLFNDIGPVSTSGAPDDVSQRMKTGIALSGKRSVIHRNRISGTEDGIQIGGSETHISENLIEDITYYKDAHPDGIQIVGSATDTTILRNKVLNPNRTTSAIIFDSRKDLVDGLTIEANYLAGGGWTLYAGSHSNGSLSRRIRIIDNVFGVEYFPRSGHFGAIVYWDRRQGTKSGNTFSTGKPVP